MNLLELLIEVSQKANWPKWRIDNTKTAIKYLTKGLGKSSPEEMERQHYNQPIENLCDAVEKAILSSTLAKDAHTITQQKNYIRFMFKEAQKLNLLTVPIPTKKMTYKESMKVRTGLGNKQDPYRIKYQDWPQCLKVLWDKYQSEVKLRVRQTTISYRLQLLELYLGYLLKMNPPVAFLNYDTGRQFDTNYDEELIESVFARENIIGYINWLAGRKGTNKCTVQGQLVLTNLQTILKDLRPLNIIPNLDSKIQIIKDLVPKFRQTAITHDKKAEVSQIELEDLEGVGLALLEKAHKPTEGNGIYRVTAMQTSLILRLLYRVPMRQRCIREMELEKNLSKINGVWTIRFQGEEMKIAYKGGELNVWELPFPLDLVTQLEEYLSSYRPRLLKEVQTNLVFIHNGGNAWGDSNLNNHIRTVVYQYTSKYFHMHLIRHLWASTLAQDAGSLEYVAFMMNDRPDTIYQKYYAVKSKGMAEKAYAVLAGRLKARFQK